MPHLDAVLIASDAISWISSAEIVVVVGGVIRPAINKWWSLGDVRADQLSTKPTSSGGLRSKVVDERVLRRGMNTGEH